MFKKIMQVIVLPMLLIVAGQADAAQKRYEVKSGYIKYNNSNGTEELYWENYGEREARYSDHSVTVFGMTQSSQSIDIIDGQWAYSYDPKTNTATKIDHQELMKRMMGDSSKQPREFGEEMIKSFGGEKIGTDKVLGKKTDIYHLKNMGDFKVWVYKGIPFKSEANVMGMSFKTEAVEYKENARIDKAKLALPKGADIVMSDMKDMPTPEEMKQARDTMQGLQDNPEFQEAMKQMQDVQNNPEFQDAMKQLQEYKNNPEFQDAMKKAKQAQPEQYKTHQPTSDVNVAERAGDIIKEETNSAVEETIRETTRDGLKKAFGSGVKSLFN